MSEEKRKDKEQNDNECRGPLEEKCEVCKQLAACLRQGGQLYYDARIPHWIIDNYWADLSYSAAALFVYLVRKANFDPLKKTFGKCWPSREVITEATGISKSNQSVQMQVLEKYKLIKRSEVSKSLKGKKWGSTRAITIMHMVRIKELRKLKNLPIYKK